MNCHRCGLEPREHAASRCLDELVAVEALGWQRWSITRKDLYYIGPPDPKGPGHPTYGPAVPFLAAPDAEPGADNDTMTAFPWPLDGRIRGEPLKLVVPAYSRDWEAAGRLMEDPKAWPDGMDLARGNSVWPQFTHQWRVTHAAFWGAVARASTGPLAICFAVLRWAERAKGRKT